MRTTPECGTPQAKEDILKKQALRLFGAVVSSRPGRALLKAYAFRSPLRHIHDLDGKLYMGRWSVIAEDSLAGRILETLTGYSSVRLHRIMRPDHDRDLHNHPFTYRTFVVQGWYTEERRDGLSTEPAPIEFNNRGDTRRTTPKQFHRIAGATKDGVWTLFFMTRNTGTWGFSVNGAFIPSTTYLLRKGYVDGGKR